MTDMKIRLIYERSRNLRGTRPGCARQDGELPTPLPDRTPAREVALPSASQLDAPPMNLLVQNITEHFLFEDQISILPERAEAILLGRIDNEFLFTNAVHGLRGPRPTDR